MNRPAQPRSTVDVLIRTGGKGTRLLAFFLELPKCLVPINGRPFLRHYLDWLGRFGARQVVLSPGHKAEQAQASTLIKAGLYLLQRNRIGDIPDVVPCSLERDFFPPCLGRARPGNQGDFPFIDIGTPESYQRASEIFATL